MHSGFQRAVWLSGVGDDWFKRNADKLGNRDGVSEAISSLKLHPTSVLEIGCSNGWRLKKLKEKYGCEIAGIDPSSNAIAAAQADGLPCVVATAEKLPIKDNMFDIVILGFCMCFISPEDWMGIVTETNRVLKDGGMLIISDFMGTRFVKRRMQNVTIDKELERLPVYIYNFNWPTLWLAHPGYHIKADFFDLDRAEVCSVLHKNFKDILSDEVAVG